jgi:hypothetical protein
MSPSHLAASVPALSAAASQGIRTLISRTANAR